jgi:hypothetical protein
MTRDEIMSEINACKILLRDTDYIAVKFAEGAITAEEYQETKEKRAEWRETINLLESLLEG